MTETIHLCSAFSLNMLDELNHDIAVRPISVEDVRDFHARPEYEIVSAVGHPDTARVFSRVLGFEVSQNRTTLRLGTGQRLIVGQYRGPRLEAGATELPPGATIEWCLVVIHRGRY